jgi:membrane associated rhomboid family serine protease
MNIGPAKFSYLPEVVKNLLIINALFFLAKFVLGGNFGINLDQIFGLHNWQSPDFRTHQFVTHLFMHGNLSHILFNMFALWMFGNQLENIWGSKRFLIYYMITGFGAALLHLGVSQFQISMVEAQMSAEQISTVLADGYNALQNGQNFVNPLMGKLNILYHTPTVGASGAVFGLLLAFGMLFPNTLIYLYFAIPIKAKYFVAGYGLLELWLGLQNNPGDNVAHFAHLGGMLFGYLLIKYWRKNSQHFY